MTVPQPFLSGLFMQTLPTLHGFSLAGFLAKDEVGKNEVATAAAAAATISFLIVFIGPPFAKALTMFADWPERLRTVTF